MWLCGVRVCACIVEWSEPLIGRIFVYYLLSAVMRGVHRLSIAHSPYLNLSLSLSQIRRYEDINPDKKKWILFGSLPLLFLLQSDIRYTNLWCCRRLIVEAEFFENKLSKYFMLLWQCIFICCVFIIICAYICSVCVCVFSRTVINAICCCKDRWI